ncbi:MAG TPA: NUDIX hydrolase [Candidatus Kapabacteria bacterium]|jgi:ADP-ribose pyrophosphatase|nr:NUDIX hydrolase [Candidatus Kapabacteria bacterium]HRK58053.1 NUDIX hydrolase [Candidatus Kapabacteria bacterium]
MHGLFLCERTVQQLEQLSTEIIHPNPYWHYCHDTYRLPDGSVGDYYYAHTHGSVIVVPYFENGTFLMVEQYRYLNRRYSLEFPGGGVHVGSTSEQSAVNELQEEAGLQCTLLQKLGEFNPCNGITDEICTVYSAKGLVTVESSPDITEQFSTIVLDADTLLHYIREGRIWDGASLSAWTLWQMADTL